MSQLHFGEVVVEEKELEVAVPNIDRRLKCTEDDDRETRAGVGDVGGFCPLSARRFNYLVIPANLFDLTEISVRYIRHRAPRRRTASFFRVQRDPTPPPSHLLRSTASQYDLHFAPHKLGNWEIPRQFPTVLDQTIGKGQPGPRQRFGTLAGRTRRDADGFTGRTRVIADDRGHLLRPSTAPGGRRSGSFVSLAELEAEPWRLSQARWPRREGHPTTTTGVGARATMGYKGIQSTYLPSSTVTLNAVVGAGRTERLYR